MRFILLFFIAVPLTEMLLLFEVSDRIGGLSTLSLVVLTAVIGVQILKRQGLSTLLRANQRIASGELPAQEIVEGMMLAGAGALLLTPGFITDAIGFIFLTGPLRRPIARRLIHSGVVRNMGTSSGATFWSSTTTSYSSRDSSRDGDIFEGEYSQDDLPRVDKKPENRDSDDDLH